MISLLFRTTWKVHNCELVGDSNFYTKMYFLFVCIIQTFLEILRTHLAEFFLMTASVKTDSCMQKQFVKKKSEHKTISYLKIILWLYNLFEDYFYVFPNSVKYSSPPQIFHFTMVLSIEERP